MGFEEARLAARLIYLVNAHVDQHDLGICVGADGMMRIAPGLVGIPDMSFIRWDRLPDRESPREPIPDLPPDLAVEVLSVGTTKPEMVRKAREYFEAGVILVWLIDPKKRTARVFSTAEKSVLLRADQALDGGDALPGFVVRLPPARPRPAALSSRHTGSWTPAPWPGSSEWVCSRPPSTETTAGIVRLPTCSTSGRRGAVLVSRKGRTFRPFTMPSARTTIPRSSA
jgi:Uma2 family endonuclease